MIADPRIRWNESFDCERTNQHRRALVNGRYNQ